MTAIIDRLVTSAPDPKKVGWLRKWTFAHRGLHGGDLPENTLLAFAAAADAGLGIECDIQRSSDGTAMVFHDWDLERMTEGRGSFGKNTAAFLETLKYHGEEYGIARLVTLLELVDGRVPVLIEIKSKRGYDVAVSCAAVAKGLTGYDGLHAVMSFDPRVPRWFAKHAPDTVRGLVMREDEIGYTQKPWQRRLAWWSARAEFLAYHVDALPNPMVTGIRARGFPVATWTVDTPDKRATALANADALIAEADGFG